VDAVIANLPVLLDGFRMTLLLLVVAGASALLLGTIVAIMRISPVPTLRWLATGYTELFRNIPLTLVFMLFIFVVPSLGIPLPFLNGAFIALTLYTSPFIAEAVRSGVNGVPVGQAEAARSIGLGFGATLRLVILPQALRMTVPPLINVLIALTKNTSVAGAFFIVELFATGRQLSIQNSDQTMQILVAVAVFYLLITVSLGFVQNRVEKRVKVLR